jgi:hypothetical protein
MLLRLSRETLVVVCVAQELERQRGTILGGLPMLPVDSDDETSPRYSVTQSKAPQTAGN